MGLAHSPRIVTNGLVLCLDAGNTKSYPGSGTTWTDISRNGNNGTLTNGPTFSSENKGAIAFDGTNDYCVAGDTSSVSLYYTISIWFKITGPPSTNDGFGGTLFVQSTSRSPGIFISASYTSQNITLSHALNQNLTTATDTTLNNNVCNVVGSYNGSKQRIHINGILSTERNWTSNPVLSSPSTQIGRWGDSAFPRYVQGNIYAVGLYNRELSEAEIQQNFNALRGRFGI